MRGILKMSKEREEFACSIANVDVDEFAAAVDAFIEQIQVAERVEE